MRPSPGEVLHFSEDPTITRFVPHVAATARVPEPYVWAVDAAQSPSYWFPRQCPRAMAWPVADSLDADRDRLLGAAPRVHAIEYGWLDAMRTATVYAYRFDATGFREMPGGLVAEVEVTPLGRPEPAGDLFALHDAAGIELRLVSDLRPWWYAVIASSLGFSGIRLRNARTPM